MNLEMELHMTQQTILCLLKPCKQFLQDTACFSFLVNVLLLLNEDAHSSLLVHLPKLS